MLTSALSTGELSLEFPESNKQERGGILADGRLWYSIVNKQAHFTQPSSSLCRNGPWKDNRDAQPDPFQPIHTRQITKAHAIWQKGTVFTYNTDCLSCIAAGTMARRNSARIQTKHDYSRDILRRRAHRNIRQSTLQLGWQCT